MFKGCTCFNYATMRPKCKPRHRFSPPVNAEYTSQATACSFTRRLSALIYDGLIVLAIWMIGSIVVVIARDGAISAGNAWFQGYLLILAWAYFASGWMIGGQTVGMRAWDIHLISIRTPDQARKIGWLDSVLRFAVGWLSLFAFGLGFIWSLFTADRAGWHDLASRSRLIVRKPGQEP